MSSERRILASRANGAKSHGPVTPEGKLASSRNSLRHGILSKTIVLPGESPEAFVALLTSYQEEHQPQTPTEDGMIENMAIARWRQQRLWSMETAGLGNDIRNPRFPDGNDFPTQAFVAFRTLTDDTRALELLNRYEARCDRQFRAALACFRSLRDERNAPNPPAKPDPLFNHKLFWIDDSGARLAADPSAPPAPDMPLPAASVSSSTLGSFGNSAFPVVSPENMEDLPAGTVPPTTPEPASQPCAEQTAGKGANDSMEIGGAGQPRPVNTDA